MLHPTRSRIKRSQIQLTRRADSVRTKRRESHFALRATVLESTESAEFTANLMVYWTIRNTREALRGSVDAAADDDHVGVLRIARASFHYLVEREAGEMRLSYGARATRKISPKCAA